MTKIELLSTYTAEQLANMLVVAMESKEDDEKMIELITSAGKDLGEQLDKKRNEIKHLQSEVEKYRKAFEDAKKERDCQIAEYQNRTEKDKTELERARNTINQIDDILEKLFGVRHDVGKPDEFEKILTNKLKGNIADFLSTEPIKVADMLIHNYKQGLYPVYQKDECGNIGYIDNEGKKIPIWTGEYEEYSELRQIAEHLLIYCNHHGGMEE